MNFLVPQFIDIEDKVFGPLTVKQFIYLVGGIGLCFIIYRLMPFFIAVLLIIPIGTFSVALAFYRPNKQSFVDVLESAFNYVTSKKLYVWKKRFEAKKPTEAEEDLTSFVTEQSVPRLSESKLSELSWSLDVKEKVSGTEDEVSEV